MRQINPYRKAERRHYKCKVDIGASGEIDYSHFLSRPTGTGSTRPVSVSTTLAYCVSLHAVTLILCVLLEHHNVYTVHYMPCTLGRTAQQSYLFPVPKDCDLLVVDVRFELTYAGVKVLCLHRLANPHYTFYSLHYLIYRDQVFYFPLSVYYYSILFLICQGVNYIFFSFN